MDNIVASVKSVGNDIIQLYLQRKEISQDELTELERQIIAAYLFGVANGTMQEEYPQTTPMQLEAGMVAVVTALFYYPVEYSQQLVSDFIGNLLSNDSNNTICVIIHKGLDGYFLWKKNEQDKVIDEVTNIVQILSK